jgi:hypothetical protein
MGNGVAVIEPSDAPYVALAEALTWVAFRHSLNAAELRAVIGEPVIDARSSEERLQDFFSNDETKAAAYEDHGIGLFLDREAALARLAQAWRAIRDEVDRSSWEVRGRYTSTYSVSEARLAEPKVLTGYLLAAFSQFDISTGGIRRQPSGQPTVIWDGHPLAYGREWVSATNDRAKDGYLMVEVRRDPLLSHFPLPAASLPVTHEEVVAWCRNWIAEGRGHGMDRAWKDFRADPAHIGLSRDDVLRPALREAKAAST